jgi:hypothetical protein
VGTTAIISNNPSTGATAAPVPPRTWPGSATTFVFDGPPLSSSTLNPIPTSLNLLWTHHPAVEFLVFFPQMYR